MPGKRYKLTEAQIADILELYPNTDNKAIAEKFGLSVGKVKSLAMEHKVQKNKDFLRALHVNSLKVAQVKNIANNYRLQREASRQMHKNGLLTPNIDALRRYHKEGDTQKRAAARKKQSDTLKKLWYDERKRVAWGLKQRTNYNLAEANPQRVRTKYYLTKKNRYIFVKKWVFAYDSNTRRNKRLEAKYAEKFKFKFVEYGADNTQ